MSYTSRPVRRPVRRKDNTPIILAAITLMALPALGFAVWKFVLNKPKQPVEEAVASNTPTTSLGGPTQYAPASTPEDGAAAPAFAPNVPSAPSAPIDPFSMGDGSLTNVNAATARACRKIKETFDIPGRKALVIWLVDRSPSCDSRREELAESLATFYPLLTPTPPAAAPAAAAPAATATATGDAKTSATAAAAKAAVKPEDAPLLSVVAQYSNDYEFVFTEPTPDGDKVVSAIKEIKSAGAGNVENTFKAITGALTQYAEYAGAPHRRDITLVVVTDEVGNDQADRDASLAAAEKVRAPVFVIGQAATFGSAGNQMAGPEGADFQQGPETREVETATVASPYMGSMMGSQECVGLGPYSLAHLCKKSGGEYYAISSLGGGVTVPPAMMPRYMSEAEYQKYKTGNKALTALFEAAKLPPAKTTSNMQMSFSVDENGVPDVAEIGRAQQPVALVQPSIDQVFEALKKGEADREKLEPRQQAAFDTAYGRIMAAKVRHEGYGVLLAAFKAGRKKMNPATTGFSLSPGEGIEKNSVLTAMATKAKALLQGVIDKFPGTPWAQEAQQELSQPIGWVWSDG